MRDRGVREQRLVVERFERVLGAPLPSATVTQPPSLDGISNETLTAVFDEESPSLSVDEALRLARLDGHDDPEIKCEIHGVTLRYSELDDGGLMSLEAGLDVAADRRCLLLPVRP